MSCNRKIKRVSGLPIKLLDEPTEVKPAIVVEHSKERQKSRARDFDASCQNSVHVSTPSAGHLRRRQDAARRLVDDDGAFVPSVAILRFFPTDVSPWKANCSITFAPAVRHRCPKLCAEAVPRSRRAPYSVVSPCRQLPHARIVRSGVQSEFDCVIYIISSRTVRRESAARLFEILLQNC